MADESDDKLRTLIVDDEPLAVERMQVICAKIDALQVVGTASDGAQALRLIGALEDRGALDRQTEGLASSEALGRRTSEGMGLTRPELAVLLSSTKLVLQGAIEQSSLPDDPSVADLLLDYFPSAMRKKFKAQINGHQLRREIIATKGRVPAQEDRRTSWFDPRLD